MTAQKDATCVFPSPSKIPYGGFSPVRLQAEIQSPPSPTLPGLSAARMPPVPRLISDHRPGPRPLQPTQGLTVEDVGVTLRQAVQRPVARADSAQRPLARQRVVLSCRVNAYYGLIRAPRRHPRTYAFARGPSRPSAWIRRAARGSPIYSVLLFLRAALRTPGDRMGALGWTSPSALAFAALRQARHPQVHTVGSRVGCLTRLQGSLNAAARRIASPSPTRAFTPELSPPRITPGRRRV
jgi:hypothetical protein